MESLGRAWERGLMRFGAVRPLQRLCGDRSPGSAQGIAAAPAASRRGSRCSGCAAGPGPAAAQPDVSGRAVGQRVG